MHRFARIEYPSRGYKELEGVLLVNGVVKNLGIPRVETCYAFFVNCRVLSVLDAVASHSYLEESVATSIHSVS